MAYPERQGYPSLATLPHSLPECPHSALPLPTRDEPNGGDDGTGRTDASARETTRRRGRHRRATTRHHLPELRDTLHPTGHDGRVPGLRTPSGAPAQVPARTRDDNRTWIRQRVAAAVRTGASGAAVLPRLRGDRRPHRRPHSRSLGAQDGRPRHPAEGCGRCVPRLQCTARRRTRAARSPGPTACPTATRYWWGVDPRPPSPRPSRQGKMSDSPRNLHSATPKSPTVGRNREVFI